MADNHMRSLAKAVSWRIMGTMITSLLVFLFTGKWLLSLAIGGIEFLVKIGAFYVHERLWLFIKWGRKKNE
jgi:adenylylsulfate kinase